MQSPEEIGLLSKFYSGYWMPALWHYDPLQDIISE